MKNAYWGLAKFYRIKYGARGWMRNHEFISTNRIRMGLIMEIYNEDWVKV